MNNLEHLSGASTALVVIDLQKGIVSRDCEPYKSQEVVLKAAKLVARFRELGALVALVHVDTKDGKEMLHPRLDEPSAQSSASRPSDWAEIVPEIGVKPSDHVVTKHNWGAFYGTDLDLQLRRRGIDTIVLCGIASGIGVDTTAREAYQHGYNQVFVSDAMTGLSKREHDYVIEYVFPRMGQIRTTDEVLEALAKLA